MAPGNRRIPRRRRRHRLAAGAVALVMATALVGLPGAPRSGAATWWTPPLGAQPWQWELSHPLNLASARDMGTRDRLPDGAPAPAPVIFDIDGIINPASTVAALHALGKRVVCYVEVGAAGNYYSAVDEGVPTTYFDQLRASGVFGKRLSHYPEYYLDIRSIATVWIVASMISRQCAAKGFDAVETDIDDEYGDDSGFPLTRSIEEAYLTALGGYIHGLGMAWWIKNPDDTADSFATDMEPLADAVLTEQCNQYSTCGYLYAYVDHKAVFNAEYRSRQSAFCAFDATYGFNGALFPVGLSGARKPCR